jgi:hypothetical protein
MPQFVLTKCRGLYSFPNRLQTMPPGALVTATNVVVNREDIIESRRGFKIYGGAMGASASLDNAKQLFIYKERLLRHFTTTLQWDNGSGTFTSFSGSYTEAETGVRIKSQEANGNFYFTTSLGIKKISAASAALMGSATIGDAGGIKALDGYAELNEQSGFFTQDSIVSYRIVWGIKDNNNNVVLGSPSERIIITNPITDLLITDFNALLVALDVGSAVAGGDDLSDTDYNSLLKVPVGSAVTLVRTNMSSLCTKLNTDFGNTDFSAAKTAIDALTFATTPTTAQLEALQDQYDAIVDILNSYIGAEIDAGVSEFSNSTQSSTVDVTFTVPSGITTSHFYQIYRTNLSTSTGATLLSDLDPGDEHKLAYEANPTSGEITAGTVTVQDIVPESFLGANLYTNPTSGEGIAQANEVPPFAKDITLFKGFTFYANTKTKHRLDLSLLSVSELTSGTSTLIITNGSTSHTYTFRSGVKETTEIVCVADTADSLNGKYFLINSAENKTRYYVWFKTSGGAASDPAVANRTGIRVDIATGATDAQVATALDAALNNYDDFTPSVATATVTVINAVAGICDNATDVDTTFTISATTEGMGENSTSTTHTGDTTNGNPTISSIASTVDLTVGMWVTGTGIAAGSKIISKTATSVTLNNNATANGTGVTFTFKARDVLLSELDTPSQQVDETARSLVRVINKQSTEIVNAFYLSGPEDVPGEMLLEAKTLSDTAFYLQANSTTTGGQFSPTIPTSGSTVISTNEVSPNRIYFSKYQQPEAVPLLNYQDVGPKDKEILRIIALRDSLFVLKEEGIYRLSGENAPFVVSLFDSSTILKARDTAAVLNNQIYMYSSQGVVTVSDTGVNIISRPIEDLLIKLTKPEYTTFETASFGVSYESDRSYSLFTVTDTADTDATQCFRYNVFTNTWTILDISKTCGIVSSADDKMYLGAADTNFIEQERKSFDRTDYADREHSDTISAGNINGTTITLSSVANYAEGDVLTQVQYLTLSQFNRVLIKLDADNGVDDSDYYSTLGSVIGVNLRTSLDDLAAKLDADAGVTDTDYASTISGYGSSFADTQDAFNDIVTKLNADTGVVYSNYPSSSGTTTFEVRIIEVSNSNNTITISSATPFAGIAGAVTIYKHIDTEVQWAPEKMGDPSMGKHARDATLIFEQTSFTEATMSIASDLSTGFEPTEFEGDGNGTYGNSTYGESTYGGEGSNIPFRTLVPRSKQRCRFLKLKYEHGIAREKFSLYGYSITAEQTSERMYRGF